MANIENYTLQRFYFEVKAMIESSPKLIEELGNTKIHVDFEIEEDEFNKPVTRVNINNFHNLSTKNKKGTEYIVHVYNGNSPADALNMLREVINKYNGDEIKDRLSIEVKED
jgi:hypothetical protein